MQLSTDLFSTACKPLGDDSSRNNLACSASLLRRMCLYLLITMISPLVPDSEKAGLEDYTLFSLQAAAKTLKKRKKQKTTTKKHQTKKYLLITSTVAQNPLTKSNTCVCMLKYFFNIYTTTPPQMYVYTSILVLFFNYVEK